MQHRIEGLLAMDSDFPHLDDSSLVLGKARKRYSDIVALEKASTDLFPNTFGDMIADDGIIMRRTVESSNREKIPFIEWLYHNIVVKANSKESLASEQRCFLLTGRAGQGKSTLCRKLFLHLKDQARVTVDAILPHYLEQHDPEIKKFFKDIHSKTTYVQARSLSANVAEHKPDSDAKFIIIDGLDEIGEDQIDGALDNIIQMIESQDEAIFLFSSRSRQHSGDGKPETIYLNEFKNKLKDANLNQSLDGQIVSVGNLTKSEKKTMFGLLNETIKEKSPRLGRLVENDSDYLKRPADFHIMKNEEIKNGVQYYLETTRWLLRRESGKEDSERDEYVRHLNFQPLLDGTFDFEQQRYNLGKLEDDAHFLKTMRTFNLIEVDEGAYYLDLTVPSSLGMLLCMLSDIKLYELVDPEYSSKNYIFNKPKDQMRCQKLKDMFEHAVEHRNFDEKIPSSTYRFSVTLLNGSSVEYRNEVIDLLRSKYELTDNSRSNEKLKLGQLSNPMSNAKLVLTNKVKLCIFTTDVLHPEDEMSGDGYAVEFNSTHRDRISNLSDEIADFGFVLDDTKNYRMATVNYLIGESENLLESNFQPFVEMLHLHLVLYSRMCCIGPGYEASEKLSENPPQSDNLAVSYLDALELPFMVTDLFGLLFDGGGHLKINPRLETSARIEQLIIQSFEHLDKKSLHSKERIFQSMCHHLISSTQSSHDNVVKMIVPHLLKHCALPSGIQIDSFLKSGREDMIVQWWSLIGDLGSENSNRVIEYFSNMGLSDEIVKFGSKKIDDPRNAAKYLHKLEKKTNSEYLKSLVRAFVLISRIGHLEHVDSPDFLHETDWELLGLSKESVPEETSFMQRKSASPFLFPDAKDISKHFRELIGSTDISTDFIPNHLIQIFDQKTSSKRTNKRGVSNSPQANTPKVREQIMRWIQRGDYFSALILSIRMGLVDIVSILTFCEMESGGHAHPKRDLIGRYLGRKRYIEIPPDPDPSKESFWRNIYLNMFAIHHLELFENETSRESYDSLFGEENSSGKSIFESLAISSENPFYFYAECKEDHFFFDTARFGIDEADSNFRIISHKPNAFRVEIRRKPLFSSEGIRTVDWCSEENCEGGNRKLSDDECSEMCVSCGEKYPLKEWIKYNRQFLKHSFTNYQIPSLFDKCKNNIPLITGITKLDILIINQLFAPSIVHSRLKKYLLELSSDDRFTVQSFIDFFWGNRQRFEEEIHIHPQPWLKVSLSESLSLGDDKALTSWHVPEEFHNPATLGSENHRNFLIHAYEDSQLLAGVQIPLSYVDKNQECWGMWDNIEIIPNVGYPKGDRVVYPSNDIRFFRFNVESYEWDLNEITSKGMYALKTSDINSYRTLEPSPENEVEEEIKKQYTIDFHQMSATLRSLEDDFKTVVMTDKLIQENDEIQLAPTVLLSAKIASDTSLYSVENDRISIEPFSGVLSSGSANHVYGHKLNFIPSKNETEITGIVEKTFQRFTGSNSRNVITSVVEFDLGNPELFLEDSLYASSGWKEKLLECNNLNEHLDKSQSGMNGLRSIRTWGILTDDGFIDQFKLNRIKEKMTKVESNLQQFSENQRVTNGRTNLMLLIRDVMTTFSGIEWLPLYKEAFDKITLEIRALFTQIQALD